MDLIQRLLEIYSKEGLAVLTEKIIGNILYYLGGILFIFLNKVNTTEPNILLLRLRRSKIEADQLSMLQTFVENTPEAKVYFAVWSKKKYLSDDHGYRELVDEYDINIVSVHRYQFVKALAEASIISFCHEKDFKLYRRIDNSKDKIYIRMYHGIGVKGNTPKSRLSPNSVFNLSILPEPRVDLRPVSSDLERYALAALHYRDVRAYDKIGYPRFDRIHELQSGNATPALPSKSREALDNNSNYKILYAPTHSTNKKIHNLPSFDLEKLEEFLRENNIELYIRMHTNEEGETIRELLEKKNVTYAGRSFSGSSVEILPYMDMMITDYSSIFMEFLPFDRPIIFIQDNDFMQSTGVKYDYNKYYPGKKVDTFDGLLKEITSTIETGDEYSNEREFVRESFDLNSPPNFNKKLKSYYSQ